VKEAQSSRQIMLKQLDIRRQKETKNKINQKFKNIKKLRYKTLKKYEKSFVSHHF
jgi:hypothetical protein